MGVLQDFERRLEGAVEGFFARAFRSRLQPVELAKALQRYAEDNRHVTTDGVVVPNAYRFTISEQDQERLATFGDQLRLELVEVVTRTAAEKDWRLRGAPTVDVVTGPQRVGRYELVGRVDAATGPAPASRPAARPAPAPTRQPVNLPSPEGAAAPAADPGATTALPTAQPRTAIATVTGPDGAVLSLTASRHTIGRLASCDLHVDDTTVSREHAAVVRRGDTWWLLDLGSTNGTRVNGVQAAEQPLSDGDEIEVGDAELVFRGTS